MRKPYTQNCITIFATTLDVCRFNSRLHITDRKCLSTKFPYGNEPKRMTRKMHEHHASSHTRASKQKWVCRMAEWRQMEWPRSWRSCFLAEKRVCRMQKNGSVYREWPHRKRPPILFTHVQEIQCAGAGCTWIFANIIAFIHILWGCIALFQHCLFIHIENFVSHNSMFAVLHCG